MVGTGRTSREQCQHDHERGKGQDVSFSRDTDQTSLGGVQRSCQGTRDAEAGKLLRDKLWKALSVNPDKGASDCPSSSRESMSFQSKLCLGAQSCLTLCNHMGCRPPGSSVHEILHARILA